MPTLAGNLRDDGRSGNSADIEWGIVLKVCKNQVNLGIEQFLLGNDRIDDILYLHPRVIGFRRVWMRSQQLPVELEGQRQIMCGIVRVVRSRIRLAGFGE